MLPYLVQGKQHTEIAVAMSTTKQRVGQLVNALIRKGVVRKEGNTYVIIVQRNS